MEISSALDSMIKGEFDRIPSLVPGIKVHKAERDTILNYHEQPSFVQMSWLGLLIGLTLLALARTAGVFP